MTSRTLFWIPVFIRLVLLLAAGIVGWAMWDFTRGLLIAFCILLVLVFVQLRYMFHLSLWLDRPEEVKLKDGWGSWTDIFAKLYRLRRNPRSVQHHEIWQSGWLYDFGRHRETRRESALAARERGDSRRYAQNTQALQG